MESPAPDGCRAVKKDVMFCLEGQLKMLTMKSATAGSWIWASKFEIGINVAENKSSSCNVEKRSASEEAISSGNVALGAKES